MLQTINIKQDQERIFFVTQHGKKIPLEFAQSVYETITKIISQAETLGLTNAPLVDNRVGDYLYDKYCEIVSKELGINAHLEISVGELSNREFRRLLNGLFLMRARRENIRSGCQNVFDLSLKNFSAYKEYDGHSYVELKKGFRPVVDCIIEKHKDKFYSRVHLKHYVKKIILSSDLIGGEQQIYNKPSIHSKYTKDKNKAVIIMCNAADPNNTKDFVVVCDNVVCTMSLGCLKDNINTLVEPLCLVSEQRRQSISKIGFGTINKVSCLPFTQDLEFNISLRPFFGFNTLEKSQKDKKISVVFKLKD
jgi:hypothetical protein